MNLMHSSGANLSRRVPALHHEASTVRSADFRNNVFSFAKTILRILAVRRQEGQLRSGILNQLPRRRDLVIRQIVGDTVTAVSEYRNQAPFNPFRELALLIGPAVNDDDPVALQPGDDGQGLSGAVRNSSNEPMTERTPHADAGHVDLDRRCVNEYKAFWVESTLLVLPDVPGLFHANEVS